MSDPFESPRALLARADEHIKELKAAILDYSGRNRSAPISEIDPETGKVLLKIKVTEDVPLSLSCIVFDIVNEIRSALDYAVFAAAIRITGLPDPANTKFPFGENAADARGDFNRKHPPAGLDELRDAIVDKVQPYKGGLHDAFWRLNKLRNDKVHRQLAPAAASLGPMAINSISGFSSRSEWDAEKQELTIGEADATGAKIEMEAGPSVAFVENSWFPNSNVLREMSMLTSAVRWTVNGIDKHSATIVAKLNP